MQETEITFAGSTAQMQGKNGTISDTNKGGKKKMVKLTELPTEKGRIELEQLQYFLEHIGGKIELIATDEGMQEGTKDKTGGLKIHFKTRDNFELTWDMTNSKPLDEPVIHEDGMGITQLYGKQGSKILTTTQKTSSCAH